MADVEAIVAEAEPFWTPKQVGTSHHYGCDSLYSCNRLPVARFAERFSPFTTVQHYFYNWRDGKVWQRINRLLVERTRRVAGRKRTPSAGIIDSQTVKTTETGGPCGFDAGKKIKGRKRHIVTDTEGSLLAGQVHTANIQDRDGAAPLLKHIGLLFPKLRHVFADSAYRGKKLSRALAEFGKWAIEIITSIRECRYVQGPTETLGH